MGQFSGDIREIDLEGFQVVSGDMFTHLPRKTEATCTIWPNAISYSLSSLSALNNCNFVRIEIHPVKKQMLVIPVSESDRDSVRWASLGKKHQGRKIECKTFTAPLFEKWGWSEELRYRASGRLVHSGQKIMLLFDFSSPEVWPGTTK